MKYCVISGFPSRKIMGTDSSTLKLKIKQIKAPKEGKERDNICPLLVERAETFKSIKPGASYCLSYLRHKSCTYSILDSNPSLTSCATLSSSLSCLSCFSLSNNGIYLNQTENTQRSRNLTLVQWWVIQFFICLFNPGRGSEHRGLWSHWCCSLPAVHWVQ